MRRPGRAAWAAGILGAGLLAGGLAASTAAVAVSGEAGTAAETAGGGERGEQDEQIDPLSVNAACYVCHMAFVHESISKVHFQEKVTCVECHGLSAPHANDEDVGATKPDQLFGRAEIDPMCRKCHQGHNAPAREVVARLIERGLRPQPAPVCTECHGEHKIKPPDAGV